MRSAEQKIVPNAWPRTKLRYTKVQRAIPTVCPSAEQKTVPNACPRTKIRYTKVQRATPTVCPVR